MFIAYAVVAVLLSALLVFSAINLLAKNPEVTATMTKVGVPPRWFVPLAAPKAAGALGLLVGLFYRPLGIAAGIGVTLFFIGAVFAHLRVSDAKGSGMPAVIAAVAAGVSVLGAASL